MTAITLPESGDGFTLCIQNLLKLFFLRLIFMRLNFLNIVPFGCRCFKASHSALLGAERGNFSFLANVKNIA